MEVFDSAARSVAAVALPLPAEGAVRTGRATLAARRRSALPPGFYRVEARCGELLAASGFWIADPASPAGSRPVTTDAFTLLRDGAAYPVTGTTYMASDVHRRFLFEPNPWVWDRDFAAMKAAGATMVRTGIWTGWRRYMSEPGQVDEAALRAFEAFLLCARRHDIPVIFTFFAFLPETWGGANAYLDPASVRAQQVFLTAFAQRARLADDVLWDLINEPSFCNPQRLWSCRPNGDEHERREWAAWLRQTYPAASDEEFARRMAERWRMTPGEPLDLPPLEEFGDRNLWESARPLRTTTYRLFAQEMFARWARTMAETLRAINPRALVMVGQDEGGTGESPNNHVFGRHMDVTCIHTWWLNDDLVWDHVVTKTPGKPNLAQETGVMFVETADGRSWRTEEESRDLLERKLAIALGVGGAGYLEWVWNLNTTMPLDNESTIGLLRPDGSAKPEFAAWRAMNRFATALRTVGPRERESVVMVVPHLNLWASRTTAADATRRAVRAMAYHCRVPLAGVSELGLDRLGYVPRLVVVPAPRILTRAAWDALGALAAAGATALLTGPCEADEYGLPAPRIERSGLSVAPVAQAEDLRIGDATHRLSFRGDRPTRVEKAVVAGEDVPRASRLALRGGALLWSPLPVELASEIEPTVALYDWALAASGPQRLFDVTAGDDAAVLIWPALYRDAVLYTFVSERAQATAVRLTDRTSGAVIEALVPAGRAAMVLVERESGRELARLGVRA